MARNAANSSPTSGAHPELLDVSPEVVAPEFALMPGRSSDGMPT
jgi:hypothetical protein